MCVCARACVFCLITACVQDLSICLHLQLDTLICFEIKKKLPYSFLLNIWIFCDLWPVMDIFSCITYCKTSCALVRPGPYCRHYWPWEWCLFFLGGVWTGGPSLELELERVADSWATLSSREGSSGAFPGAREPKRKYRTFIYSSQECLNGLEACLHVSSKQRSAIMMDRTLYLLPSVSEREGGFVFLRCTLSRRVFYTTIMSFTLSPFG